MTYIFNKNHNRTHAPGCPAIDLMNQEKNMEIVEEPRGHSCGWCGASVHRKNKKYPTREHDIGLDKYIGERICPDPALRERLKELGCACGSHQGDVRMYPHSDGILVSGVPGLWWVYFHCFDCGHDTSQDKLRETFITREGRVVV
jgi:hypothetical protein